MIRSLFLSGVLILFVLLTSAVGEDLCSCEFAEGTQLVWTNHDEKNGTITSTEFVVKTFVTDPTGFNAKIETTARDKDGVAGSPTISDWKCNMGTFSIDPRHFLAGSSKSLGGDADKSYAGDPLVYPKDMKIGDTLQDAKASVTIKLKAGPNPLAGPNGGGGSVTYLTIMKWKDRICDSIHAVTTPAGTWTCFKIRYKNQLTVKTPEGKADVIIMDCIEWFSPRIGTVRCEAYVEGKLTNYSELTKINAPK